MESALTLLPQPDSPTSATVSPSLDVPGDVVDGAHDAAPRGELGAEMADVQKGRHGGDSLAKTPGGLRSSAWQGLVL